MTDISEEYNDSRVRSLSDNVIMKKYIQPLYSLNLLKVLRQDIIKKICKTDISSQSYIKSGL